MDERWNNGLRWAARVSGAIVVATVVLFYIGEGGLAAARPTLQEGLLLALFTGSWLGLIVAWRWEFIGGAINVGGMVLFYLVHFAVAGRFPGGWAFVAIAVPGALFLVCSWRTMFHVRRAAS